MDKIKLAIVSRTTWTIVALFVINGFGGIHDFIPHNVIAVLDPILSILAIYFRVNPQAESKV